MKKYLLGLCALCLCTNLVAMENNQNLSMQEIEKQEQQILISSNLVKTFSQLKSYCQPIEINIFPDPKLPEKHNLFIYMDELLTIVPLDNNSLKKSEIDMSKLIQEAGSDIYSYSVALLQNNNSYCFCYQVPDNSGFFKYGSKNYWKFGDVTLKWVNNFMDSSFSLNASNISGVDIFNFRVYDGRPRRCLWNNNNILACLFQDGCASKVCYRSLTPYHKRKSLDCIVIIDPVKKASEKYWVEAYYSENSDIRDFAWNPQESYNHMLAYIVEICEDYSYGLKTKVYLKKEESCLCIIDSIEKQQRTEIHFEGEATNLAWNRCGNRIAVAVDIYAGDAAIKIFDFPFVYEGCEKERPKCSLEIPLKTHLLGSVVLFGGLAYGPYDILAVASQINGKIFFFNSKGKKIHEIATELFYSTKLVWSQDGKYIAAANDSAVQVWEIQYLKSFKKKIKQEIKETKFEYDALEKSKKLYSFCVDTNNEWFW